MTTTKKKICLSLIWKYRREKRKKRQSEEINSCCLCSIDFLLFFFVVDRRENRFSPPSIRSARHEKNSFIPNKINNFINYSISLPKNLSLFLSYNQVHSRVEFPLRNLIGYRLFIIYSSFFSLVWYV